MLNILDFGAVADGVTDNTAAIQAAIDKAAEKEETVFTHERRRHLHKAVFAAHKTGS